MRVRLMIGGWVALNLAFLAGYLLHGALTNNARMLVDVPTSE